MLYLLEENEFKSAAELYSICFNISEPTAFNIFECFAQSIYASKENDVVKGIICAAPLTINNQKGVFLHGGATQRLYRNSGVFKELLSFAINNNNASFFAIKNTSGYEDFYSKLGFKGAFAMRSVMREIKRNLWARADFDTITAKKLCEYRRKYSSNSCAEITVQQAGVVLSTLYSKGISTAETAKAYAFYYRLVDKLLVTELYAESDVDAWFLLEAMADRDGRNTAQLLLSCENTVFAGEGKRYFSGMTKGIVNPETIFFGDMPN